jgi:hypothetical protein
MPRCQILCIALGCLFVASCGKSDGGLIKTGGTLKWEDGTPISQAMVNFIPDGEGKPASGFSGNDGSFELTTSNSGDGIAPGKYKVVVTKADLKEGASATEVQTPEDRLKAWEKYAMKNKGSHAAEPTSLLPKVYGSHKTTPLQWEITAGGPKIELKLKKL